MTAAGALTPAEGRLIDGLTRAGHPRGTATLAVTLWARRYVRPEAELLDLVSNYPRLDEEHLRTSALGDLRARGWVIDTPSTYGGPDLVHASPDLEAVLAELLPGLRHEMEVARRTTRGVSVLGHMGELDVYDSFATRLAEARSDIALPMVMTTHRLDAIGVLKDRADAGTRVRVLLATPGLAGDIRGRSASVDAKTRLSGWRLAAKGHRNLQIRVTRHRKDIRDASSMLIDSRMLRYDVYDDETERTTDGVMIEIAGLGGTNLTRMFQDRFDEAWSRARPLGFIPSASWVIRRWWWTGLLAVFVLFFVLIRKDHPTAAALVLGGVIGYIVNHLDPIALRVRQLWERLRT